MLHFHSFIIFRKESTASCPITKAKNNSHFHLTHFLSLLIFPASINEFFPLFVIFSRVRNKKVRSA